MADMPTNEPLLDSHSGGAIGYDGMKPINLKEIVAEGKFGIVRRVSLRVIYICSIQLDLCECENDWFNVHYSENGKIKTHINWNHVTIVN